MCSSCWAASATDFCARVRAGLANADFMQKRQLIELLIDRVLVSDGTVEIRYVLPLSSGSEKVRFCHLRKEYFDGVALLVEVAVVRDGAGAGRVGRDHRGGPGLVQRAPEGVRVERRVGDQPARGQAGGERRPPRRSSRAAGLG